MPESTLDVTWFEDLTPYSYGAAPDPALLNVGWLSIDRPIPTGATPPAFGERLREICTTPADLGSRTSGIHACEWCARESTTGGVPEGSIATGEIRVRSGEVTFAAPVMVHHYVVKH